MALNRLTEAELFSGSEGPANRRAFDQAIAAGHNPGSIADGFIALNQAGLLMGEEAAANRDAFSEAPAGQHARGNIANGLIALHQAGLLVGDEATANRNAYVQMLISAQSPETIARGLIALNEAGLLVENEAAANRTTYIQAVLTGIKAESFSNALITLSQAGLLIETECRHACLQALSNECDPEKMAAELIAQEQAKKQTALQGIEQASEKGGVLDQLLPVKSLRDIVCSFFTPYTPAQQSNPDACADERKGRIFDNRL